MTVAETIALAEQHAKNGNVPAACRILDFAICAALSNRSKWKMDIAKARILDAAVNATVAASHRGWVAA
jgi:hypothetical protein